MEKLLLLGDEAVAQGALDAGISGVYAYPGTPSSEITEYIQRNPEAIERNVQREWCVNEKNERLFKEIVKLFNQVSRFRNVFEKVSYQNSPISLTSCLCMR